LDRAREEFEAARANVVLIGQLTPRHAAHFRRRQDIHLPVLADEKRQSYKAAGAKIATINELLGPKVIAKGTAVAVRTGLRQGRTLGHPAQLGGAMVITPEGAVAWSHMSENAGDNASPEEILAAVRDTAPVVRGAG
jgi:prostamide/prostaglandin F2alpha synthase